jgi:hypothetical protein
MPGNRRTCDPHHRSSACDDAPFGGHGQATPLVPERVREYQSGNVVPLLARRICTTAGALTWPYSFASEDDVARVAKAARALFPDFLV